MAVPENKVPSTSKYRKIHWLIRISPFEMAILGGPGIPGFQTQMSKHGPLGHRSSFQKALERWPLFCQWLPPIYLFGSPKSKHFNDCIDLQKKKLRAPFRSKCSFKRIMGSIDRSSIESREQKDAHIKLGATMHRDKMPTRQETMQGDKLDGALDSSGHPDFTRRKNTSKLSHSLQCQKKPVVDNYEGWYFPLYLEHVLNPWELPQNPTV